jgi:hypothetical protein
MKSTEEKSVAQNSTAENDVISNVKTPPAFNLAGDTTTGETEGLNELALTGGTPEGPLAATGTPPATETVREADELGRVHLKSKKDNAFHASRWENLDGTTTAYAETFKEKIKIELKREFGKDITHAEVLKMIEDAKKANDLTKAEEYRKKLFRANQYAVVETLNVDKTTADGKVSGQNALGQDFSTTQNHEMYGRISGSTYCNIYAYDVVTALGAYIPRVWWTKKIEDEAIAAMEAKTEFTTTPKYGENVSEMNANALNAWFDRVGKYFGWRKAASMEEGQTAANNGNVVVLQAANKVASKSGHIAVILSERDDHKASRDKDKKVDVPLTSQAGSVNHKYKTGGKWWEDANHKNGAAWIHDGAMSSPLLKPEEIGVAGAPTTATTPATTTTPTDTPTTTTKPVVTPVNNTTPATTTTTGSTTNQQPVTATPAKEAVTGGTPGAKEDKSLTVSRGVLQMTSEGSFNGDSSDVRTPHFPENLAIYTPIAAGEKIEGKNRYDVTGDRAKKLATGGYKRKTLLNRHEVADYDTKVTGADKIATGPNNSGVTIGFGYDIGAAFSTSEKEKCKKDLKAAGITEENAEALSAAVGLRTMAAGRKTAELRKTVKITADQAVNLLGVVMGRYDANYTKGVVHPAIEEAFSYVNYWKGNGGGKAFVSKMFEAAKDKKGAEQFTAVIGVIDSEGWGGGFDVIKNYLKVIKGKIEEGYDVSFVTKTSLDGLLNGDNDTFDIVKESAKGTYIGKKDYHEQLTGKPKADTGGTTTGGKETTPAKPAVKPADATPSIIKDSVGSGGKNNPADVRIVKQCLYNAGLAVTVNDTADQAMIDAIIAFQKAHFSWTPDGLVSPGKNTAKKLAEFKNVVRPVTQQPVKPAAVAQETPTQRMEKEYKKYSDGQIDMIGLAKAMKLYAVSSPATVIALIGKLGWTETDNFAYAFASHSTDAELASYNRGLLKRLSDELDAYMTLSRTANLGQKARIDKAISKPIPVAPTGGTPVAAGKDAKPAVKPVAQPVASEKAAPVASTATGSTRTPVVISKSVGVGGNNDAADLKKIQDLLKDIGFRLESSKLQKNTNGAIAAFQQANGLGGDGRVDPGGKTLETMNNTPTGAFKNTAKQLAEDKNAPNLTHSKWTNRAHFATDTAGEIIPRQFYGNMTTLIKYMEIIADNLKGTFNVNCGYRSPHHNANTSGSAERSNHQFGRAVDIDPTDYTPKEFAAELRRLIKEGKIHAGGIGTYGTFVHYDIDSSREWNG